MTINEESRSVSKAALLRELEQLRKENAALKAQAFRRPSKTAATYLRVLAKMYGPETWATPLTLHLTAQSIAPDYEADSASTSALESLKARGYIERHGSALRITQAGMNDEAVTSVTTLGVVAS